MTASINASTSSGVIVTSDTSGALALQTANTTAVTIDTSQNVGIGVTPSAWSNYKAIQMGSGVGLASYTAGAIILNLGTNQYYNGTNYVYVNTDFAASYQQTSGIHKWWTAPSGTAGNAITLTQALTLNANGALVLQGGSTSATGVGVAFPATQSASSDANTLDDYEEGTFTPTFTNISAGATKTGAYVKIGRMVFVNIYFGNMACTGTSAVTIGGLPFTRSSSTSSDGDALTPYELYQISNPTGNLQWLFSTSASSTTILPIAYNGTTGASITTANFSFSSASLGISGWYQTAT